MRQKLKQKWSDLRLAGKMALVYLLLLFAALVAALAALQVSFSIYDGQLYEKSLQELDFFRQRVNDSLRSVENFSYELATSVEIQSQLAEMKAIPAGTAAYSYQLYRLRSLLTTEIHTHPIVKNVRYTDGQKSAITVGEAVGEVGGAAWEALLREMHAARGAYVTHDPAGDYPYQLSGRDILKFSDSSLDYLGSCVITCDVRGMIDAEISALSAADPALCVYNRAGTVRGAYAGAAVFPVLDHRCRARLDVCQPVPLWRDLRKERGGAVRDGGGVRGYLRAFGAVDAQGGAGHYLPYAALHRGDAGGGDGRFPKGACHIAHAHREG